MDLQTRIKAAIERAVMMTRLQMAIERGAAQYFAKQTIRQGIRNGIRQAAVSDGVKSAALAHLDSDDLSDEEKAAIEWAARQVVMRQHYERGLAARVVQP